MKLLKKVEAMKDLKARQASREQARKEQEENKAFPNAEFLREAAEKRGNTPGQDHSKGSTEGTAGDATVTNAADKQTATKEAAAEQGSKAGAGTGPGGSKAGFK